MRKATVRYHMKDRAEYAFTVEGAGQREWLQAGERELIAAITRDGKLGTTGAVIESFETTPEDGSAGKDKQDGVAIRSSLQKLRMDLMPTAALAMVARVFTFGAFNYGDHNWRNGFSWSRCSGAAERHHAKWKMGQDNDKESGINHLAHDIANKLFLLEFQLMGLGRDDRVKYPPELIDQLFAPFSCEENR